MVERNRHDKLGREEHCLLLVTTSKLPVKGGTLKSLLNENR